MRINKTSPAQMYDAIQKIKEVVMENNGLDSVEVTYPQDEEVSYAGVPEGVYWVKIDDVRAGKSSKGYPMFATRLVITEDTMHGGKHENRLVWNRVTFIPYFQPGTTVVSPGAGIARQFLKAIGHEYKGAIKVKPASWKGLSLGIRVKYKNNNQSIFAITKDEYTAALQPKSAEVLSEEAIF